MPSTAPSTPPSTIAIVLAGGSGSRFAAASGATTDKLLARLPDGRPVAVAAVEALHGLVGEVIAVLRPGKRALAACLRDAGCTVLETPDAERGMGATLAAAARLLLARETPPDAFLVALADMPWIRPATLRALVALAPKHRISGPVYGNRRGHPVGFSAALLPELATLDGDVGARALLQREPVYLLRVDDPGVLRDVDRPADLRDTPAPD